MSDSLTVGPAAHERIADGIWSLRLPLPDGHLSHVFTYLIEADDGIHVIDPGWRNEDNWTLLVETLAALGYGLDGVASVAITHLHSDHMGLADRLVRASGAPLVVHRVEQESLDAMTDELDTDPTHERMRARLAEWGVPSEFHEEVVDGGLINYPDHAVHGDLLVNGGDDLPIPGRTITVISTPGHTRGSMCLRDDRNALLFTGDHVLPTMHPGLGLGAPGDSSPLADYFASLDAIEPYDDHLVLPGHGHRFHGLVARTTVTRAHHLRRSAEVAESVAAHPNGSVWEIAAAVRWSAGWTNLHGPYLFSALSQTAMHTEFLALA